MVRDSICESFEDVYPRLIDCRGCEQLGNRL